MTHHEQMLDAQAGCLPCKLCGGKAIISDAGTGAGYYIRCANSLNFRDSKGCLISERRLGGWAYNVRDWWNRLHARTPEPTPQDNAEIVERVARALAEYHYADRFQKPASDPHVRANVDGNWHVYSEQARIAIRSLSSSRGEVR